MMNIHGPTSQNLPSIRIQDHQTSYDSSYDDGSSAQRSLPLNIPLKSSSPAAIRGSHHGMVVPPLLPLLPPNNHSEWDRRRENGRDRPGQALSPMNTWGSESSERGFLGSQDSYKDAWDIKRQQDSLERETRNGLSRIQIEERQPASLQSEESRRKDVGVGATMIASMSAYDRDLLRKLSPIPPRNTRPQLSPVDDGPFPLDADPHRRHLGSFTPSSSPIAIGSRLSDSPFTRWKHDNPRMDPITARMALSPEMNPPVFPAPMDYRTPASDQLSVSSYNPCEDSLGDRIQRSISGSGSFEDNRDRHPLRLRKSFDPMADDVHDLHMEDTPSSHLSKLRHLNIGSETPPRPNSYPLQSNSGQRAGSKRRASSPPTEDRMAQSEPNRKVNYESGNEPQYRRSPVGPHPSMRYSPGASSKFHPAAGLHNSSMPRSGSSFASSAGTAWSNSLGASSLTSAASSFTNQDRNSPVPSFSPPSDIETPSDSPYLSHSSLASSRRSGRPRASMELPIITKQERDTTPQKHAQAPKISGHMCQCCPKKPKKFDSLLELKMHEMEKQYTCNFCNNRFKNKNEAERHQNSLHLRKHSWSCAALSGVEAAFHPSTQRLHYADVCGYCGKEFPVPANMEERIEHLTTEHKFGECNQSKKFFRADHFRQHLKHSHSGTAGKWTSVLENACMRDEPVVDAGGGLIGLGNAVISEE